MSWASAAAFASMRTDCGSRKSTFAANFFWRVRRAFGLEMFTDGGVVLFIGRIGDSRSVGWTNIYRKGWDQVYIVACDSSSSNENSRIDDPFKASSYFVSSLNVSSIVSLMLISSERPHRF